MYASFLTHAMDDLLAACVALTRGESRARASWDGEPTEYRWLFSADRFGVANVRLLILKDLSAGLPDTDGYARRWERPFPAAGLRTLERWSAERVQ